MEKIKFMSSTYLRYKKLGLCRRCGAQPLPGKIRCKKCNSEHRLDYYKIKQKLIELRLCRCCKIKSRIPGKTICLDCLKKEGLKWKKKYAEIREQVITSYEGQCVCCGQTNRKYLQLDHINNDGKTHRAVLSSSGRGGGLYAWAKRNNYPNNLQLLCANCHQAKTSCDNCTIEDHFLSSMGKNNNAK